MSSSTTKYIGRFAPSPSGPLHLGSLLAATASYLDAKAHNGRWLLRIEDIDTPRVVVGADSTIMRQLEYYGMHWDGAVLYQSNRLNRYEEIFQYLQLENRIYGCSCTRKETADRRYDGRCRNGSALPPRSWRLIMPDLLISFEDRIAGLVKQNPYKDVGDIIVKRADGLFAYQLVVVIDDADQCVTDIVRGSDLLDSTCRQIAIQNYINAPEPAYMHVPLILDEFGRKLSKQNHAEAIDAQCSNPLINLNLCLEHLGFKKLDTKNMTTSDFWEEATKIWASKYHKQTAP
ncbi:tRNA glutamyl-Q(34) synthetase GluQRS [Taylorella equigenitalis]|uniref:Glutamyl-Q tRNA(Asp) synthetase n=2 Tax=Taylorella equigenitalis TaxID=29575 RepID=A0A654KGP4_TAYEM|nr:tRNA glutamyl-Q(34) synthetase GluQRS [Taylorella equigenitalis]ADU91582.1 glutamyl-Q-tRNA synthetase [Taylorella equigenitalis MCE9]AFN35123.1 putative glutamyl-q tRNA(Asp) synthetase [Taylorella equigenitalis ATCC 35865]ASY38567.1 tRNA glutamyl-Q(34) synthetase GluQRS [Taylorella equigenitalis]ASY41547.1 tRNA glutamyl-Q(34) synthetase GluQRS [Taylorella equigenitalis]RBA27055.1 tRNA glutamyl-Q(34) synthetase GluQRS [Taylorella equigenitalis]